MTKWIAYANLDKFDINRCFNELGISHWKSYNFTFRPGDEIYFFVSDEKRFKYKAIVEETNLQPANWDDDVYWLTRDEEERAQNKKRMKIRFEKKCMSESLLDEQLRNYGLPERKSFMQKPVKNEKYATLINHIATLFNE